MEKSLLTQLQEQFMKSFWDKFDDKVVKWLLTGNWDEDVKTRNTNKRPCSKV